MLFWTSSIFSVKYFKVVEENKVIFGESVMFVFLLPILATVFCFRLGKGDGGQYGMVKKIILIFASIIALLCSIVCCVLFEFGGICSVTSKLSDYRKFDESVENYIRKESFLFPQGIPDKMENAQYSYELFCHLDNEIKITLTGSFADKQTLWEQEEFIKSSYQIIAEKEQEGKRCYFTAVSDHVVFAAFDDVKQTVFYGYFANTDKDLEYYENMVF